MPELNRPNPGKTLDGQSEEELLARIEERAMACAALTATSAMWGNSVTDEWWLPVIDRWAVPARGSGPTALIRAANIPASMLNAAALTAAVAGRRYDLVRQLLKEPYTPNYRGIPEPAAIALNPSTIFERQPTPNAHVHALLRPVFVDELALSPAAYDDAWETGEVLREAAYLVHRTQGTTLLAHATNTAASLTHLEARQDMARKQGLKDDDFTNDQTETEVIFNEAVTQLAGNHWQRGHVRVSQEPSSFPREQHLGVVAASLAARVQRERDNHPLVAAQVLSNNWHSTWPLLLAVAQAQGRVAHEVWRKNHINTVVGATRERPDYFWLDTCEPVDSRR